MLLSGPRWRVLEGVTWGRERARRRAPFGSRCGCSCQAWGHGRPRPRSQPPGVTGYGCARPALQRPPPEQQLGLPAAAAACLPRPGLPAGGGRRRAGPAAGTPRRPQQPRRECGARTVRTSQAQGAGRAGRLGAPRGGRGLGLLAVACSLTLPPHDPPRELRSPVYR
ncbi:translation initiation factor IF-2-like isoform X1 [Sapajus apella]|uniref:Translation initiation factor IF-2-like isoform X1 n=1 Tax=Sapajus apella TaxID=9515 RepID=A0A6J3G440_SAPAP|nr:translation initiation factor IF-2-like isoform X1 [Sapajus apella]